jgi:hypothetical protein
MKRTHAQAGLASIWCARCRSRLAFVGLSTTAESLARAHTQRTGHREYLITRDHREVRLSTWDNSGVLVWM